MTWNGKRSRRTRLISPFSYKSNGDRENRQPSGLFFGDAGDIQKEGGFRRFPSGLPDFACDFDGLVEISRFDYEEPTQLLAGFGEWAIGDDRFAMRPSNAGSGRSGMER